MLTLVSFDRLLGIFASLVVLAPLVQAQLLVTVPGLPECAETCADRAALVAACIPITQKCLCETTNSFSSSTIRCAARSCNAANAAVAQAAVANFCAAVTTPSPSVSSSSSSPVVTQDTTVFTTVTSSLTSTSTSDSTTSLPPTTLSTPTTTSTPPTLPVSTSAPADSTTVVIETVLATPTNAAASLHPGLSHGHGNDGTILIAGSFFGLVLGAMAVL